MDRYYLFDQGSRNGTYVNGKRIQLPTLLNHGDIINIGETTLEFVFPPMEPAEEHQELTPIPQLISTLVVQMPAYPKLAQQISERVQAEIVYQWFSRSIDAINSGGSQVDQVIGGAIVAIKIHQIPPDLLQVAIDEILPVFTIIKQVHLLSEELNQQFQLPLSLGISAGINTSCAEIYNGYPTVQTLDTIVQETLTLQSANQITGQDVSISAQTRQRTPYSILLPFKQYLVNLPDTEQPTITYAGSLAGVVEFLDKVSVVFS
jgi:adenylate cyclase